VIRYLESIAFLPFQPFTEERMRTAFEYQSAAEGR